MHFLALLLRRFMRAPLVPLTILAFALIAYGVVRGLPELHTQSISRFDNVEISGTTDATGIVTARAGVRLTTPTTGPIFISGAGVPALSATIGSLYLRTGTAQVYQNTDGATTWTQVGAAAASGGSSIYGSGFDGVVTFDGRANPCDNSVNTCASLASTTYTLTRNVAPTDMSIAGGYTVVGNGYVIVGNGTISGAGTYHVNGNAGQSGGAGNGGAATGSATLPGGIAGGNAAINGSSSPSKGNDSNQAPIWWVVAQGGAGGSGSVCANQNGTAGAVGKGGGGGGRCRSFAVGGAGGGRGGDITATSVDAVFTDALIHGRPSGNPTTTFTLGTGGGGAASSDAFNDSGACQNVRGGGGGGSAGWGVIVFKTWTFTGTINAIGGAGGTGPNCSTGGSGGEAPSGGGGGSGGVLVLIKQSGSWPSSVSSCTATPYTCTAVAGGAGGAGGTYSGGSVSNFPGAAGGSGGGGYANLITTN